MKNCIYEPVFGLFLLFNFQIDSALTFSSRLITELSHIRKFSNPNHIMNRSGWNSWGSNRIFLSPSLIVTFM